MALSELAVIMMGMNIFKMQLLVQSLQSCSRNMNGVHEESRVLIRFLLQLFI